MAPERPALLPALRPDLEIFPAPPAGDGSSQHTLYDPVTGKYLRLGWAEAVFFAQWETGLPVPQFLERLRTHTTLRVGAPEVQAFLLMIESQGLLACSPRRRSDQIELQAQRARLARWRGWWVPQRYFFFRIPLLAPEPFLKRTFGAVRWLASAPMLAVYALLSVVGLALAINRWQEFLHTFPYFLTAPGLLAFAATTAGVKLIHEFSHAFVARAYGVRVRSMGIMVLFGWPVPYSDVTDGWRMASRRPRFWISSAGIAAELILAGVALFGWVVLPDGLSRSLCFMVSSVTLAGTMLANLNPAMRFDGYFILSDLLGVDNLRQRSLELTRWALRRALLGWSVPPPETIHSRGWAAALIFYAIFSWAWRFVVFFGIAIFFYAAMFKAIGLLLGLGAIWSLLLRPILAETAGLWRIRRQWIGTRRARLTAAAAAALLLWLGLPLPRVAVMPAVLEPADSQTLYVPFGGLLRDVAAARGAAVTAGRPLFRIESEELETRLRTLQLEEQSLTVQMENAAADERRKQTIPELAESLAKTREQLKQALEQQRQSVVTAAADGLVLEWDEQRDEGQAVGRRGILGRVATSPQQVVTGYVAEADRPYLSVGDPVRFYPSDGAEALAGTVREIDPARVQMLEQAGLSSNEGGEIDVEETKEGARRPVETYYRVEVVPACARADLRPGTRGRVRFTTPPRSLLAGWFSWAVALMRSESTF